MNLLLLCFLRFIALFRHKFVISPKGTPYLIRWYLTPSGKSPLAKWWRRNFPGVFLHCFVDSDPDRGWHSHPWTWAVSYLLKGAYRESRPLHSLSWGKWIDSWLVYGPGELNYITGADWPKVKLLTPKVWTLFIVGPLHGLEWSFMSEDGTITPHGTDTPGD